MIEIKVSGFQGFRCFAVPDPKAFISVVRLGRREGRKDAGTLSIFTGARTLGVVQEWRKQWVPVGGLRFAV
jgi:hypothetical protein